ncbi:hypothetical protein vseg_003140 [Gypsophila vaccaria]
MDNEVENISVQNMENYYDDDDIEQVYDSDEQVSDCESVVSNDSCNNEELLFDDANLVSLDKDDPIHNVIHDKFMAGLGDDFSKTTTIMAIHKKIWSDFHGGESRLRCFEIYRQSLRNTYGDDNNMKYAWYATSKGDVTRIMSRGFGAKDIPIYDGLFGDGVGLSPINFLKQSVGSCVIDDDGLEHIMLCRVLIESEDVVTYGDSSESRLFDSDDSNSGVEDNEDDNISQTKYVIGSTKMNTHILPEYVVSFKTPLAMPKTARVLHKKPISPWLPFATLISALAKLLPPEDLNLVIKQYRDFKERKISRLEFIKRLKCMVGVDLLSVIVKLCGSSKVHRPKAMS